MYRDEDEDMQRALEDLRRATQVVDYYLHRDKPQRPDRAPASSRYREEVDRHRSPVRNRMFREVSPGTMREALPERAAHWKPTASSGGRPERDRRSAHERRRGHEWNRARSPQMAYPERECISLKNIHI